MNYCFNHPDAVVTAYCQNCGKPLCSACARDLQGNIYCDPCYTARTAGPAAPGQTPGQSPGQSPGQAPGPGPFPGPGFAAPMPPHPAPNPGTAAILGFIPGVGAMYNGQYIKAIVHVLVFVVLVGMVDRFWFFGLLIGFWVIYQVFDAYQTARARREGLPLPDPFGLNELGNRIGGHASAPHVPPVPPVPPAPGTPPPSGQSSSEWAEQVRQQAHQWGEYAGQMGEHIRARVVAETAQSMNRPHWAAPPPPGWQAGPMPPIPPVPPIELQRARREPIGAIVLILLGMLFLFNTLGFFSFGWVHHGWPLIIIAVAVWLLARNSAFRGRMRFGPPPQVPPESADKQPGGGQ